MRQLRVLFLQYTPVTVGRGRQEFGTRVDYNRSGRPDLDVRTSGFEGSHRPVGPHGREGMFICYNDV